MVGIGVRATCAAGGELFGMMVEGSRGFKARKCTCCCCARQRTAASAARKKVTNPASGVERVEVVMIVTAIRPEKACQEDMRMSSVNCLHHDQGSGCIPGLRTLYHRILPLYWVLQDLQVLQDPIVQDHGQSTRSHTHTHARTPSHAVESRCAFARIRTHSHAFARIRTHAAGSSQAA